MAAQLPADEYADVVVIGAGVSGLRAASELQNVFGMRVVVLEARNKYGGRVQQDYTFLPGRPLEVGAEFIHGDINPIVDLCLENGWSRREIFTWSHGDGGPSKGPAPDGGIGYYYLGNERKLMRFDADDEDMHKCNRALWALATVEPAEAEADKRTLRQYLIDAGVPERLLGLACAGYGNTAGGTADSVPVSRAMRFERAWHGDGSEADPDFRMEPSYAVLIDHLARGLRIITSCPVTDVRVDGLVSHADVPSALIEHQRALAAAAAATTAGDNNGTNTNANTSINTNTSTSSGLVVHGPVKPPQHCITVVAKDGRRVHAHRCIVTAPLPVLQTGEIRFAPELGPAKTAALASMSFANGVKIVLKFSRRAWPNDCHGVVCADSFVPEMWMNSSVGVGGLITAGEGHSSPVAASPGDADEAGVLYTVTGFLMGVRADTMLATHSHAAIIARLLSQIDAMFGMDATTAYIAGFVHSWADEPYIRGAYSTPTKEEDAQGARRLAEPHCRVVFFAGEATAGAVDGSVRNLPWNQAHYASPIVLHGAMNTGSSAACDVARSMGYPIICTTEDHQHFVAPSEDAAGDAENASTGGASQSVSVASLKSPTRSVSCVAIKKIGSVQRFAVSAATAADAGPRLQVPGSPTNSVGYDATAEPVGASTPGARA